MMMTPRGLEIPGWRPAGASLSHGQGDPSALVGNPPRDGVTIKILVIVAPYHHSPHYHYECNVYNRFIKQQRKWDWIQK